MTDYVRMPELFNYDQPQLVEYHTPENDWNNLSSLLEGVYLTLHGIDWAQTRYMSRNYGKLQRHEANPILGRQPHKDKIDAYFALTGLAHAIAASKLSSPYRELLQGLSIGMEYDPVRTNYNAGLKMRF